MTNPSFPIDAIVEMYCGIEPDADVDPAVDPTRPAVLHVALKGSEADVLAFLPEDAPPADAAALVIDQMIGVQNVVEFLVVTEMLVVMVEVPDGQEFDDVCLDAVHPKEMAAAGDPRASNGVIALWVGLDGAPEVRIAVESISDAGEPSWVTQRGSMDMLGGPMERLSKILG